MPGSKIIQSIERATNVLDLFVRDNKKELSIKEISTGLGLNKSTAFGIVNTLNALGFLEQNKSNLKYSLGLKLLSYQNKIPKFDLIERIIHPHLLDLSDKYLETVHCATLYNDEMVYLDKIEAFGSVIIPSSSGGRNYMHCTGVGKCILSSMSDGVFNKFLQGDLKAVTPNSISDPNDLKKEIQKVKEQGFAIDNEEIAIGITCYAVPVLTKNGEFICSISLSGISKKMVKLDLNQVISDLKNTASLIANDYVNKYNKKND